jgi:hypothetical protein
MPKSSKGGDVLMADEEAENIGGISVSIGASHARLPDDLAAAERVFDAWLSEMSSKTIQIRANLAATTAQAARATSAPVVFGPKATAAAQAASTQPAFVRAINAELAKTGQTWDATTNEITSATKATREQKAAIIEVQQQAAQSTPLNVDTGALQNDLNSILGTLREIVGTAKELGSLPTVNVGTARGGAQGTSSSLTSRDRAVNTDLATRITRGVRGGRQAGFPPLEETRGAAPSSGAFAPPLGQADRAALLSGAPRTVPGGSRYQFAPGTSRRQDTAAAALRAEQARDEQVFAASTPDREAQRQRQIEERIALQRATITAAGRTGRTESAGLGALFGGTQGKLIEARAQLSGAERAVTDAERAALPFRKRIAEYDIDIANSSGKVATARIKARDAFVSDPKTVTALNNERKALEGQESALARLNKLQGGASILRNLGAVALGGAAFGAGLQVVGAALAVTDKALSPVIDRLTGFGTVAARVTDTLSDQTRQAQGNAQAVVALAEAQAGLSSSTAKVIQPLVTQQATIEAGNKAFGDAINLFQTYQKLRTQGIAGITTSTGGPGGTGIAGTPSTAQALASLFGGLPSGTDQVASTQRGGRAGAFGPPARNAEQAATNIDIFNAGIQTINDQLVKGGDAIDKFSGSLSGPDVQNTIQAFKDIGAPIELIAALASKNIGIAGIGTGAGADQRAKSLLQALATSFTVPDQALLQQQFNRQNLANIAAAGRQQAYQAQVQLPTQFALGAFANPNLPVGTGIAPEDQAKVAGYLKDSNDLQAQLNAKYQQGQQIIDNTYKPAILRDFGNAAAVAFAGALADVKSTGAEIAKVQQTISNEQAGYQVAQYNFQLLIAKRTLGDIAGLTGANLGVQKTQLGVLEGQNLALSREAQQLQFALSQRQINYQVAVAGFSAPGVTPEERQANIAEAKIEASYAQKQLDIQRQMFGNQVKIVDIGNLRQGTDLLKQIGLLQQGRQVTLDTKAAEEKLNKLNQIQSQNVAQVGTYLSAVDNLASTAIGQIQQMEAAAGKAMANIAVSILGQFGIFFTGVNQYLAAYSRVSSTGNYSTPGGHPLPTPYASGGVMNTTGPVAIGANGLAGEAGNESLIILSRPRSLSGGSGTGQTIIINFNGPVNANRAADLDYISRAIMQALGKQGSILGLRSVG